MSQKNIYAATRTVKKKELLSVANAMRLITAQLNAKELIGELDTKKNVLLLNKLLKLQEDNKKRFAAKEIMIMKKLMLLIALLFMGVTVSPASAEGLKKYTFSIAVCSDDTAAEYKTLAEATSVDADALFRLISKSRTTERELLSTGEIPISGRAFLSLIKEKTYPALGYVIGLRYSFKNKKQNESEVIVTSPLDIMPSHISIHVTLITVHKGQKTIARIKKIAEKLESHEIFTEDLTFFDCEYLPCTKPGTLKCSKCFTHYCSSECQKLDWKAGHKNYCTAPVKKSSADTK